MIGSQLVVNNCGLLYCTITEVSAGRKPKRQRSMDRVAKIVIQTIVTFWTSLWIFKKIIIILKCILGVAKLKYDAGFMHQCKRLHLISRNHKIFWRRETRGYVFICDSLLSAVQPTWFYEYTVYCIQYANTFLYICV